MEKKTHLKQNLIPHLLNESQNNEDLTIICKNGKFYVNNFLFASIFPGLTSVIEEGLTSVVGGCIQIIVKSLSWILFS